MNDFKRREIKSRILVGITSAAVWVILGLLGVGIINTLHYSFNGYIDKWEKFTYLAIHAGLHTFAYFTATVITLLFRQKSLDWTLGDMGPIGLRQLAASIEENEKQKKNSKEQTR